MNKANLLFIAYCYICSYSFAGDKSEIRFTNLAYSVIATEDFLPMWLHANQNGIFSAYASSDVLWLPGVKADFQFGHGFSLQTGFEALVNADLNQSRIQQLFAKLNKGPISVMIGKKNFILNSVQHEIGTGNYLFSGNAQPYWRMGAGILHYTSVPGTGDFVQIKGAFYFGWLNENRKPEGINNPYIHDKYGYIKFGRKKFIVYTGLLHSVIFGGEDQKGITLPVDIWPTILGTNSEKVGEYEPGEGTNAPGTHNALWDFGVTITDMLSLSFKKPFKDNSGKKFWRGKNNDFIAGIHIKPKKYWLQDVYLEYFQTITQSGPGATDYAINGRIMALNNVKDPDQFMIQYYDTITNGWNTNDLIHFVQIKENNGYEYGGRDEYFNNWLYGKGYSYKNRSLGTPLFYTYDQMMAMVSDFTRNGNFYFVNNRIISWHFGLKGGNKNSIWEYKLKLTKTKNYGNYTDKYKSYRFEQVEGYYFNKKPDQYYSLLEVGYKIQGRYNLKLNTAVAADFGDIYSNYGVKFSVILYGK